MVGLSSICVVLNDGSEVLGDAPFFKVTEYGVCLSKSALGDIVIYPWHTIARARITNK